MSTNTCPRCKGGLGENPARSRVDGTTKVCTPCGSKEAMWAFETPDRPLPALTEPVPTPSKHEWIEP